MASKNTCHNKKASGLIVVVIFIVAASVVGPQWLVLYGAKIYLRHI
jgi:hypothetical protein